MPLAQATEEQIASFPYHQQAGIRFLQNLGITDLDSAVYHYFNYQGNRNNMLVLLGFDSTQIERINQIIDSQNAAGAEGGPLWPYTEIYPQAQAVISRMPEPVQEVMGPTEEELAAPLTPAEQVVAEAVHIGEAAIELPGVISPVLVSAAANLVNLDPARLAVSVEKINADRKSKGLPPLPAETIAREIAAAQEKLIGATDETIDAAVTASLESLYNAANPETANLAEEAIRERVPVEQAIEENRTLVAQGDKPVGVGSFLQRYGLLMAGLLGVMLYLKRR